MVLIASLTILSIATHNKQWATVEFSSASCFWYWQKFAMERWKLTKYSYFSFLVCSSKFQCLFSHGFDHMKLPYIISPSSLTLLNWTSRALPVFLRPMYVFNMEPGRLLFQKCKSMPASALGTKYIVFWIQIHFYIGVYKYFLHMLLNV